LRGKGRDQQYERIDCDIPHYYGFRPLAGKR